MNVMNAHQFVSNFQALRPQYVPRSQRTPTVESRLDRLESPESHVEKAGHPALGENASLA